MQLVPTNRQKSEQQRSWRDAWRSRSIARLHTEAQLAREAQRQQLLDRRWRQWRSMILTFVISASVITGAIPLKRLVDAMLKAVGLS